MSAHTPGPWKAIGDFIHTSDNLPFVLAYTPEQQDGVPVGDRDANAQLIAAAPEMLAALKRLVDLLEVMRGLGDTPIKGWSKRVEAARAAIAKATGEPS